MLRYVLKVEKISEEQEAATAEEDYKKENYGPAGKKYEELATKYPESPGVKDRLTGPIVRKGAKIGANATLLPGVVVGEYALVGAGTVVVRDVPAGAVVVGNPGRVIRHISELPYAIEQIG